MNIADVQQAIYGITRVSWEQDPKHLLFVLARYKFVAKMLEGTKNVLEVGCGNGFGSRIVRQHVGALTGVDVNEEYIEEARSNYSDTWPVRFKQYDILDGPWSGFDAVYCLDVFEHICNEDVLLGNLRGCAPLCIIGTPSLESQAYASEVSRLGHVNCVAKNGLRERMKRHWRHVFVLGMNDETLHCGFDSMTHYLFGIGCS